MTDKRCAFLTMDNVEGWSMDADLGIAPLQALDWQVDTVPWRAPDVDWDRFDAVYLGTPWDYPEDVNRFIAVLERIDESRAVLVNELSLVRWNIPKTYLRDLETRGAEIVPSDWHEQLESGQLPTLFDSLSSDRIVIKPVVSTNATDTFLLTRATALKSEKQLVQTFAKRPLVAQPFVESIQGQGEYSLFYFSTEFGTGFSHAIRKTPKSGDFRVQEEHGADIVSLTPEIALVECADRILQLVEPTPVYGRCDLVQGADGRFLLMELELVEPSLYLRMDAGAAARFAAAFDRHVSVVLNG